MCLEECGGWGEGLVCVCLSVCVYPDMIGYITHHCIYPLTLQECHCLSYHQDIMEIYNICNIQNMQEYTNTDIRIKGICIIHDIQNMQKYINNTNNKNSASSLALGLVFNHILS